MNKGFFIILFSVFTISNIFTQGELNDQPEIFYRDEKTMALMLNTNGLGLNLSYAKRMDAFRKTLYQFDIVGIKHPKEIKITLNSPVFQSGGSFVYGKLNKFYNLRLGLGNQKEIYRKIDKGGISIRRYYAGGVNLGIEKPVYFIVEDPVSYQIVERRFDTTLHANNNIIKYASYFKGFDEINVKPGVYAKFALMFEYGKYDEIVHALEGGIVLDLFPQGIEIMAHNGPDLYFVSLYISYRFGKVVDSRFKTKKNKADKLISG